MTPTDTLRDLAGRRLGAFARTLLVCAVLMAAAPWCARSAAAQAQTPDWQADIEVKKTAPGRKPDKPAQAKPPANTTGHRARGRCCRYRPVAREARRIAHCRWTGIDEGLVWRVYQNSGTADSKSKLVTEKREAAPALKLQPGDSPVNASFGRANLTRRLSLKAGGNTTEKVRAQRRRVARHRLAFGQACARRKRERTRSTPTTANSSPSAPPS